MFVPNELVGLCEREIIKKERTKGGKHSPYLKAVACRGAGVSWPLPPQGRRASTTPQHHCRQKIRNGASKPQEYAIPIKKKCEWSQNFKATLLFFSANQIVTSPLVCLLCSLVTHEFLRPLIGSATCGFWLVEVDVRQSLIYDGQYKTMIKNSLFRWTFREKKDFMRLGRGSATRGSGAACGSLATSTGFIY